MIPSDLPVAFKIPIPEFSSVRNWLDKNGMHKGVLLDWSMSTVWFYDKADATAFYLRYGFPVMESKIKGMMRIEESNN